MVEGPTTVGRLVGRAGSQLSWLPLPASCGAANDWWLGLGPDTPGYMVWGILRLVPAHWWIGLGSGLLTSGLQALRLVLLVGSARSQHSWLWGLGIPVLEAIN